jgi:hypothetical protein
MRPITNRNYLMYYRWKIRNRSFNYGPDSLFDKIYPTNSFFLISNSNIFKYNKPNKQNKNRSFHTDLPKQKSQ